MFLYRDILKKSLSITWTHKNLWFLGIFAAILGGVGQYAMTMSRSPEDWTTSVFSALAIFFGQNGRGNVFFNLAALLRSDPVSAIIFIGFILIVIIVGFFILWLAIISQAGLISNSAAIIKGGNRREALPLRTGLNKGVEKFWPMLGFNLIGAALTCFFAALIGSPLVFMTGGSDPMIFWIYTLLFIIFIPLSLIISFLIKYAINYSVIKEKKFIDSLIDACRLFGKYWLISIEMALILFVINFLCVFALAIFILAMAIPYVFVSRLVSLAFFIVVGTDNLYQLTLTGGLFLALIAVVMGGAIVTVFETAAWTDIFVHLSDKKGGLAKLERMAAGMRKRN